MPEPTAAGDDLLLIVDHVGTVRRPLPAAVREQGPVVDLVRPGALEQFVDCTATGGVPIPTHSVDAHSTACPSAPSTDFASAVIASPATEDTTVPAPFPSKQNGSIPQPKIASP